MAENSSGPHDRLIRQLATGLEPVRRLPPPVLRALLWLAAVAAIAVALGAFADLPAVWRRITAASDMSLAVIGTVLTAVLAALAAFHLSMPDSSRRWALLPLPAAALWIGASGIGCLRAWFVPDTHAAVMSEARDCLIFIVGLSVPLSALLVVMLRRACPLQPGLTAAMGGLAAAAAGAALLNLFHPFDAAATDLVMHAIAVALVVGVNRMVGERALGAKNFATLAVTEPPGAAK